MDRGADRDGPLPVSWDEARELVSVMLLAAALMVAAAPGVRFIGTGSLFDDIWDDLATILANINPIVGLLVLASAVSVCTVPPIDVVPALRRAVLIVAVVVTVLGVVAMVIELTSPSANRSEAVWIRFGSVLTRSGPAVLLASTAAWMARRVVPFPP